MNRLTFPGVRKPLSNFDAVKTDLQTQLLVYEIDLSTARSIAANTAEVLRFAGNSLYIDKNSDVGNGTIIFQDDSRLKPARVFAQPGFIARVPWTQIIVENQAQAGKVLRIFYGVDVDFVPGTTSDFSISGSVDIRDVGYPPSTFFRSSTLLGALGTEAVFLAAANTNGALIYSASLWGGDAVSTASSILASGAAAPVSLVSNPVILHHGTNSGFGVGPVLLQQPIRLAAGQGLWRLSVPAQSGAMCFVNYSLL